MDTETINGIEDLRRVKILKDLAKNSIQKLMNGDYAQMAVLTFHVVVFYHSASYIFLLPIMLYFKPQTRILCLLYYCWVLYDRNTPKMNGRKSKWYCNLHMFTLLRNYFPIRLIKTADLPEGRNYILAHYPHSVLPYSIMSNFLTNWNRVADTFPGIEMHYITLDILFMVPILREIKLALGAHCSSESTLRYLLNTKPSKGIIVVPGGAAEIQYTTPGNIYTIIKRKGFVRVALATGTPLVPVFTFGENNTWTRVLTISLGERCKRMIKFITNCNSDYVICLGRGLLPKKFPVNTVVGAPIPVPKVDNPSKELVDEYYEIFFQALEALFEKYKNEYDVAGEKAKLVTLEK